MVRTRARTYKPKPRTGKRRILRKFRKMGISPIKNYFKYKRFCPDTTIKNTGPGVVVWDDARSNWVLGSPVTDDNGLYQFGGTMRFQLDDVISHSDFTNLYDRYKITGAKVTFIPLANMGYNSSSSSGNSGSATIPTISYSIDYDDSVMPNSSLDILDKMDARVRRLDKPFSVYVKNPKVSLAVDISGGATTALGALSSAGYFNCANDSINFRGLKFWIRDMDLPDGTAAVNLNSLIRIQVKYYVAFKDPQ